MPEEKETEFALDEDEKESISVRIRQLIGTRTVRMAAREWGLSFSTLNNYLTRGTEPSLNVAIKIANVEGVSVEWLATGEHPPTSSNDRPRKGAAASTSKRDEVSPPQEAESMAWNVILNALDKDERALLINSFVTIGARRIIRMICKINDVNSYWQDLTNEEKERLIRVNEQMKKGTSETDQQMIQAGLTSSGKKAG
ncbi:helix-turn-helix domain-containing protein [Klebsiella variicola]|uniref:helix-turn-helix domain-containing protein n=1 Tax=Klebsiella variicola TaxID=244366 RepID=UPI001F18983C|nr:helix-turn-helix transcriptional regulator [Klebsiella variicola]MCF6970389.1 helix-turn-helix domain-containing protein [Klebsiella variicola]